VVERGDNLNALLFSELSNSENARRFKSAGQQGINPMVIPLGRDDKTVWMDERARVPVVGGAE
jgi:hypothetical protein